MSLILPIIIFFLGLFILVKSSDYLVDGASSIAGKFNISPIVVGLTIVAFGTSAPELVVSITSALSGSTDIALGNVVGSNIFNILFILGVSALIYPISLKKNTIWKEIPFSLLAVLLLLFFGASLAIDNGQFIDIYGLSTLTVLSKSHGLALLSIFVVFMYYVFGIAKTTGDIDNVEIKEMPIWKSSLTVFFSLIFLSLSAKFLVTDSAIQIAKILGVSEALIGLTIVAIGTSLPELATSVTAAVKKNSDIAIGNVVGSNIFNILFVLGTTLMIKDVPISGQNVFDIIFLVFTTVFLFISVFVLQKFKLNKIEGISMIILYIAYTVFIINR
jgi:cation:H+ antiporter